MSSPYTVTVTGTFPRRRIARLNRASVFDGGYRGYGGKCLPKDVGGIVDFANENGVALRLLETAREVNDRLLRLGVESAVREAAKQTILRPPKYVSRTGP